MIPNLIDELRAEVEARDMALIGFARTDAKARARVERDLLNSALACLLALQAMS